MKCTIIQCHEPAMITKCRNQLEFNLKNPYKHTTRVILDAGIVDRHLLGMLLNICYDHPMVVSSRSLVNIYADVWVHLQIS